MGFVVLIMGISNITQLPLIYGNASKAILILHLSTYFKDNSAGYLYLYTNICVLGTTTHEG